MHEVTAVVGFGRFGRALCELLDDAGSSVRAWDPRCSVPPRYRPEAEDQRGTLEALVRGADIVVLSVPIAATRAALAALRPHLRASHLVIDVGSVKLAPSRAMHELLGADVPWIASHPLFGPSSLIRGERPLRVVLCPNEQHPAALGRARAFYEHIGCELIEQSADQHDRGMASTHALAYFIAKGLIDIGAGEDLAFVPPSFHAIARTVESVRADAGHLFFAIQHDNPHAAAARRRLLDALLAVDEHLGRDLRPDADPTGASDPSYEIPDLGAQAPELLATRDLLDELDRELVALMARRAQLSRRAGRVKAARGMSGRDPGRERQLLESRGRWGAAQGLEPAIVQEVFQAILRHSRAVQRR